MTIRGEVTRDPGQPRRFLAWRGLGRSDVGEWLPLYDATTASVHAAKLPDGVRIIIEGSHEERPAEGVPVIELDSASMRALPFVPRWVRPVVVVDGAAKVPRTAFVIIGAL